MEQLAECIARLLALGREQRVTKTDLSTRLIARIPGSEFPYPLGNKAVSPVFCCSFVISSLSAKRVSTLVVINKVGLKIMLNEGPLYKLVAPINTLMLLLLNTDHGEKHAHALWNGPLA